MAHAAESSAQPRRPQPRAGTPKRLGPSDVLRSHCSIRGALGRRETSRYDDPVTSPTPQPGDRRPQLARPPSDRYGPLVDGSDDDADRTSAVLWPAVVVLGGSILFVLLGGLLGVTGGLLIVAAFEGWLLGRLVSPPWRAALVGLAAVVVGLLGIWLFGRLEGGVLDPLNYLAQVHGMPLVILELLAGTGLAAAASR